MDLESWPNCFPTAAPEPLQRVLAQFALADLPVAFKSALQCLAAVFKIMLDAERGHLFTLPDVDEIARVLRNRLSLILLELSRRILSRQVRRMVYDVFRRE